MNASDMVRGSMGHARKSPLPTEMACFRQVTVIAEGRSGWHSVLVVKTPASDRTDLLKHGVLLALLIVGWFALGFMAARPG